MKVSQLLPVRPEPNTQMMFSGRMPTSWPLSLLASIDRKAASSCSCLINLRVACLVCCVLSQLKTRASPRFIRFLINLWA